jgi:hypothetical protein
VDISGGWFLSSYAASQWNVQRFLCRWLIRPVSWLDGWMGDDIISQWVSP